MPLTLIMLFRLKEYSFADTGTVVDSKGSPRQDDCMYPPAGASYDNPTLFVMCDGMGQDGSGYAASSAVCGSLVKSLGGDTGNLSDRKLSKAISDSYTALDSSVRNTSKQAGTTMALLKLYRNGAVTAHIGNSRVYHIRPGHSQDTTEILYATYDHTYGNLLVQRGECTPEEAATHPKRTALTRAMLPNMEKKCVADIHRITDIRPGDYFYLCTDGMTENIDDDYLRFIFSHDGGNMRNKRALLEKASSNSVDNRSAIIVNIIEVTREVNDNIDAFQDIDIDNTSEQQKNMTKDRAKDTKVSLPLIFLLSFIALMSILMLIYSLFIRENEVLQQAGTAIDKPLSSESEETYGYEITAQDIVNEATQIAPEPPAEEVVQEEKSKEKTNAEPENPTNPSPDQPDEPILQM